MFGLPAAKPLTPDVSFQFQNGTHNNYLVLLRGNLKPPLSVFQVYFNLNLQFKRRYAVSSILFTEIEAPEEEVVTESFWSHDCASTLSCRFLGLLTNTVYLDTLK